MSLKHARVENVAGRGCVSRKRRWDIGRITKFRSNNTNTKIEIFPFPAKIKHHKNAVKQRNV